MNTPKYKMFCPEHYTEIENYELAKADNFKGWVCHHRNGEYFSKDWLVKNNMYFNRKDPHEFKFMTLAEHNRVHWTGRKHTNESRQKMAEARKGKPSPNKGKHLSDETRKKMSEHNAAKGKHWKLVNGTRIYY